MSSTGANKPEGRQYFFRYYGLGLKPDYTE